MVKKVLQVLNGGSTTITHKSNISSRPITVPYLMKIKPIIFVWYYALLHSECSQADLELIIFPHLNSIPLVLKWLEDTFFALYTIEGASPQEFVVLKKPLLSTYPNLNIVELSPDDRVKTLMFTLNAEFDRYVIFDRVSKFKPIFGLSLNLKIKPLLKKVRYQRLTFESPNVPKSKSFSMDLRMIVKLDKVVTEIATDSDSVPLTLATKHMHPDEGGGLPPAKDIAYADDLIFFTSRADSCQFKVDVHRLFHFRFGLKFEYSIILNDEADWWMD